MKRITIELDDKECATYQMDNLALDEAIMMLTGGIADILTHYLPDAADKMAMHISDILREWIEQLKTDQRDGDNAGGTE